MAFRPDSGSWPLLTGLRDLSHWTHHTRWDSSGRVISQMQRPVPDNTRYSQETNMYATDGVRTRKTCKQAAADPRLRPLGQRERVKRPSAPLSYSKGKSYCSTVKMETAGSPRNFEVYLCTKTYGVMSHKPVTQSIQLGLFFVFKHQDSLLFANPIWYALRRDLSYSFHCTSRFLLCTQKLAKHFKPPPPPPVLQDLKHNKLLHLIYFIYVIDATLQRTSHTERVHSA